MLLTNKVAVITGAASGIGESTALAFAEHGASIVVADVDAEGGEETVDAIASTDGQATFVETDVSKSADVRGAIETAVSTYGGLDVLHNNAGMPGQLGEFADVGEATFDDVVDVNLRGTFLGIKYGIQAMLADGGGSIISTSSIAAQSGFPGRGPYAATKAGINGMTRVAAVEYAEDDIRVNVVLPGTVDTPMGDRADDQRKGQRLDYDASEAMGGKGQPEEIANAVVFLASDLASRITGVTLPVDGGFLANP